jgi:CHRD domain
MDRQRPAPTPVSPCPLTSPIKGTATLTDAQAADLQGGKYYFNIHTDANKPGEIRGQVVK